MLSIEERQRITNKLLDAPPGTLTAREILSLPMQYMQPNQTTNELVDEWLEQMDRKVLPRSAQ